MNGSGDQLLAGSGLTKNEYGRVCRCNLLNLIEYVIQIVALADNVFKIVFQFDFFLKISPFSFKIFF